MMRLLLLMVALVVAFVLLGVTVALAPPEGDFVATRFALLLGALGLDQVLDLLNRVGQLYVWIGFVFWFCVGFAWRRRWDVVALLVLGELSELAVGLSKTAFGREGPVPPITEQFDGSDFLSYPSGHVTRFLVTLGVLALYATPPRWRPVSIAFAALGVGLMALARVAFLEHWLTDALGGVLLGGAWLALLAILLPRLRRMNRRRVQPPASPSVQRKGKWSDMKRLLIALPAALLAIACAESTPAFDAGSVQLVVELRDYSVNPSVRTVKAGDTKIGIRNVAAMPHDLTVIRTDLAPDKLPYDAGKAMAVESGSAGKEMVNAGRSASMTAALEPGSYVLICNVPGHYQLGMRTALTVER